MIVDGDRVVVESPIVLAFVALVLGWMFAVVVIILVTLEFLWPSRPLGNPVTIVREAFRRRDRARRYAQIVAIASRHGLGMYRGRSDAAREALPQALVAALAEAGVTFVRGHGRLAGEGVVEVAGTRYVARVGVVLNTGTAPAAPPVDGLADTPFWTNRDVLRATEAPSSLVVVGGGAIGAELAQAFARFGSRVSVLEMAPRILALEEPEASEVVAASFARDGVQVLAGATIGSVAHADGRFTVAVTDADGTDLDLDADRLLVAAGRRPNLHDIGLETVGLDPSARSLATDERMRAGEKLWAIGDITGKGAFTHMSMYQAGIAVRDLTGTDGPWASYHAVPRVTFTDPEVGAVGMTEQQARDAGLAVRVGTAPLAESTRGWIHGPGGDGVVKVVEDADAGHLVGATSVGPTGGEVLSMLATAVHARVPTAVLREQVLAYPTFHRAVSSALADLG
ncbi:MAG: FAD-dependent oxidoreductase [Micrococcales bacterium]|nr:FAD-dependent oxidoreductase [Micrococcales bacterium]